MNKEYIYPTKDLLNNNEFDDKKYYNLNKLLLKKDANDKLIIPIGIDENKSKYYIDLKDSKGIFIGGETGSGKSVLLDSLLVTLLFKNSPDDLKLLLIDPNKVELMQYKSLPHLITDVVYETNEAIKKLNEIVKEIDKRKDSLVSLKCKNIDKYNEISEDKMKHIIILIDEAFSIMEHSGSKEILEEILRNGYLVGVHLILATNSYFAKNFDKEFISLFDNVLSLDLASSEQANFINLKGSNLLTVTGEIMLKEGRSLKRLQAPYISTEEINKVVDFIITNN